MNIKPSRKQNTDFACDSVAYDPVKTKLSESESEAEEKNNHSTRSGPFHWLVLPFLLSTPTIQFSLDHKRRSRKRNRKKLKRSDFSDSDFPFH